MPGINGNNLPENTAFLIVVLHPKDNVECIPNQLIVDGLSDLYSINSSEELPGINDESFGLNAGTTGMLTTINALHRDMGIDMDIEVGGTPTTMDDEDDTPYGFKLSQIFNRIGNINSIEPNNPCMNDLPVNNGWGNIANIYIFQNAYDIEKCGCRYAVFEFKIKNVGTAKARKVLFKDIFPNGVHPREEYLYMKYSNGPFFKVKKKFYDLKDRRLLLSIVDLREGEEITIIIGCIVDKYICPVDSNVGVISWVGWQSCRSDDITLDESSYTIVLTKLSNHKKFGGCTEVNYECCTTE